MLLLTWIRYYDYFVLLVLAALHVFPCNVTAFKQTKRTIAPWRAEWISTSVASFQCTSGSNNYRSYSERTWYHGVSYPFTAIITRSNEENRLGTVVRPRARMDATTNENNDEMTISTSSTDFWESQKELVDNYNKEEVALKTEQTQAFQKRRLALVSDTIFFTFLIFSILWFVIETPQTALSYLFGATLSVGYSYGLGKYVESLGSKENNGEAIAVQQQQPTGDFGQARFALIIVLLIALAKFRGQTGLQEIPTIAGFFTYQLASLNQGFKDLDEPM